MLLLFWCSARWHPGPRPRWARPPGDLQAAPTPTAHCRPQSSAWPSGDGRCPVWEGLCPPQSRSLSPCQCSAQRQARADWGHARGPGALSLLATWGAPARAAGDGVSYLLFSHLRSILIFKLQQMKTERRRRRKRRSTRLARGEGGRPQEGPPCPPPLALSPAQAQKALGQASAARPGGTLRPRDRWLCLGPEGADQPWARGGHSSCPLLSCSRGWGAGSPLLWKAARVRRGPRALPGSVLVPAEPGPLL